MDLDSLRNHLKTKPAISQLVYDVIEGTIPIPELLQMVQSEKTSIKYYSSKVIRLVSEQQPQLVYPYFNDIATWLSHTNSFIKWDGILTLANLIQVDTEKKFNEISDLYFSLIQNTNMITAANVVGNAWKIVLARPEWENKITQSLLEVPHIIYLNHDEPSPECNNIVCGQVINSFEQYYEHSGSQDLMLQFAETQLKNSRKSTAKKAEVFLKKHSVRSPI